MFTTAFDYGRAVERLREQVGDDPSSAVPTVDAAICVGIKPTGLRSRSAPDAP